MSDAAQMVVLEISHLDYHCYVLREGKVIIPHDPKVLGLITQCNYIITNSDDRFRRICTVSFQGLELKEFSFVSTEFHLIVMYLIFDFYGASLADKASNTRNTDFLWFSDISISLKTYVKVVSVE